MTATLFRPLRVGALDLQHRIVMAPLTRSRATQPGNVPGPLAVTYYAQRATPGGLIIAEASPISPSGHGFPTTPGIYTPEQIAGWRAVVDAVHGKGGKIVLQLWHVGRVSHSSLQPEGRLPVAPSAIRIEGLTAFRNDFSTADYETPHALTEQEIEGVIADYAQATRNARAAGFDGVEIHAANGYLLEQFLQSRTNHRTDAYGGSIENRARLLLAVAQAVTGAWSADRVGIRLSPFGIANDSGEAEPLPLYTHVVERLARVNLAYLHLIEPRASGAGRADVDHKDVPAAAELFRPLWPGVLITAGNFRPDTAEACVAAGHADAIAFGRFFISNPDLVERIRRGAPLTPYDRSTFYRGGATGYTDYPTLAQAPQRAGAFSLL
ncbi:alkene reductase [Xanthobacter oligotrophicus]|uniref:alkene reductase n=1 Tax=Xanthobacter oligotrophicus TaxID=2607286 RepID=UPI0011F115F8|nr:alkene reductase [Xanthobacter oligotrophicus]MCG5235324.1 alkene reductase [Xanthobacter oligotrophicus]